MSDYRSYESGERLYRNRETGVILGVCSGLAEYFDIEAWMVRVLAVVSLYFFTTATALAYIVLGLLLQDRPLSYRGRGVERSFWAANRRREHDYR